MSGVLKIRGGTTAEHATFTGEAREITVDTTKNTVVVHDGTTAGGFPLARRDDLTAANTSYDNTTSGLPATVQAAIDALADDIATPAVPPGSIIYVARNTAPAGFLKANGAAVSRTTYADLFAAIGTTFGAGNGSTTFDLPDLRGEFIRGWDDGRGVDAGRAFGSAQADAFRSHSHTGTAASAGAHTHTFGPFVGAGGSGNAISANAPGTSTRVTSSAGAHTHTLTINATGGAETRPRNIALLACIKY